MENKEAIEWFKKRKNYAAMVMMGAGEMFDLAIAALEQQEQDRWIPITEKLPEPYKEVIVTDIETIDTYTSEYHGGGYWNTDTGDAKNRIIAWMPLPEPYEAEEES